MSVAEYPWISRWSIQHDKKQRQQSKQILEAAIYDEQQLMNHCECMPINKFDDCGS